MDSRIPRLRRKLAKVPFVQQRSHSFGEEQHKFRLAPPLSAARVSRFEAETQIELPDAYRAFLTELGGSGASPFYGLLPLDRCELFTMDSRGEQGVPRGFTATDRRRAEGDLFLNIIEAGCSDLVLLGITGPLTGRILTGNSDGFWGPNVSSASDFLAWYERWLDHMASGRDNRALELTSPAARHQTSRLATRSSASRGD
ncbi:SMI1/KNR4 family protein [Streptacidiphilus sp. P02-A3a]|uniref:SMI1/KNR4 family protein n=1 Tax=Streptacidiphilus sp. P02-A3a TaxID=2704468 RepID=UPI0015FC26B7|nr:SMI1/KNR4 family protein [Streptacidiphilus sp. P02-A3a]QMU73458.1 SMI1/KNR4 family protein [Streptacidiphilus sp. P02-A3a]